MSSEIISRPDFPQSGESEAKAILERYLTLGENLQWSDKPQVRWKQDLKSLGPILVLFLIFYLFFVANFFFQSTSANKSQQADSAPTQQDTAPHHQGPPSVGGVILASALMAAFLSFWCYTMFKVFGGQKILNLLSLSKTYYGLTDHRLIMVSGKKEFRVLSYHLRCVQGLRLREETDGVRTINLGPQNPFSNPFQSEDLPPLILKNMIVLVQSVRGRTRFASQPPPSLLLRGGWASKRFFAVVRGCLPCCQPVVMMITRHLRGRQWLVHKTTSDQRQSTSNAITAASG